MYIDNKFVEKYDGLINARLERAGIHGDAFTDIKGKIYERIMTSNSYDPDRGKITTWLWNICRSVISNEVKKNSRSQDVLDHPTLNLDEAYSVIGPEDAGTIQDELSRLFEASDMSYRDEAIVRDVYLEEYTYQQVADKNGMSLEAVKKVITRAMQALRAVAQA